MYSNHPIANFSFATHPEMHFGLGIRSQLSEFLQKNYAGKLVLLTGRSISQTGQFGAELLETLSQSHTIQHFIVSGEPSPDLVDEIVLKCDADSTAVVALGGGSVLDAAKAVAGLIPSQTSVMDYLEGVGAGKPFNVETCPFIAVPTTAGTGSETTKNAVLSRIGYFKKSFRDNKLLARSVWLDPELLKSCPKDVLYATGMDAFTQLLESYTTKNANPITDALALQGMKLFKGAFEAIDSDKESEQNMGYSNLMLAATLSGTTLANAGLGAVHGLAGPIGAFFEAPHGIVCAKLLAPITQANIEALHKDSSELAKSTLDKYQTIAKLFDVKTLEDLILTLKHYAQTYTPQGLGQYGLTADNLQPVIDNCRSGSMLGNVVSLPNEVLINAMKQSL